MRFYEPDLLRVVSDNILRKAPRPKGEIEAINIRPSSIAFDLCHKMIVYHEASPDNYAFPVLTKSLESPTYSTRPADAATKKSSSSALAANASPCVNIRGSPRLGYAAAFSRIAIRGSKRLMASGHARGRTHARGRPGPPGLAHPTLHPRPPTALGGWSTARAGPRL